MKIKVTILMSTYNGEMYLDEQLESIFNQENVDVDVLVRDDGSNDNTINILDKWAKSHALSYYEDGQNIGPKWSFMNLIKKAEVSDYYAFADQDDVWSAEKLDQAISSMSSKIGKPCLFMSTYDVVDEELNKIFTRDMEFEKPFSLATTIMYRCPSGCTMVFNYEMYKILRNSEPKSMRMHDFWTLLSALSNGAEIVTLNKPLMKYRQHGNNTVGFSKGEFLKKFVRLVNSTLYKKHERQKQAIAVLDCYKNILSDEDKVKLNKVKKYRENIFNKFALLNDKAFKSKSMKINLLFKIAVITGVF